jgi:hypothetical protein
MWVVDVSPCQTAADSGAGDGSVAAASDRSQNIARLPSWLRVGFEYRSRVEANIDPDQDRDDRFYLNRIRLAATVQPARWVRFFVEGQDARAVRFAGAPTDALGNAFEMHQGYVEVGRAEQGWQMRFGRQELAVGDERLVSADSYWDWFGQAFDALQVSYAGSGWRADAFTGFRIESAGRRVNPFDTASRVSGLAVTLQRGWGSIEPYVIWKRGNDIQDLMMQQGHKDVAAPGVLLRGDLPGHVEFDVEMALERGHVVGDSITAWAGHWELGWRPWGKQSGPRLGFEYNYASGDPNPADGRYQTFDDMYPAGYNKLGMMDPIAWRNIKYPFVSLEMPLAKRWKLLAGYRSYRLAEIRDGLYPGGDEFLARYPEATSTHVGSQLLLSAAYEHSAHWKVYAGYGIFFPGAYLREAACPNRLGTFYLQPSYTF